MLEGAIEREIKCEAAAGDHPVENVASGRAQRGVIGIANAKGRNRWQGDLISRRAAKRPASFKKPGAGYGRDLCRILEAKARTK
ncbi:MAG: hypothetical protein PVS2B2_06850 [Candidatus Acidiferrum sp.]